MKQQKSFQTYHLRGWPASRPGGQVLGWHWFSRLLALLWLLLALSISGYRRQFPYVLRSTQRQASTAGLGRHVWCREDLLDKEVSSKRLSDDFLRRPHRGKARIKARGGRIRRNQRSRHLDGLAGQPQLHGARSRLSWGRNPHPRRSVDQPRKAA